MHPARTTLLTEQDFYDIFIQSSTRLNKSRRLKVEIHRSPLLQMLYFIKSMRISDLFSEDISFAEYIMLRLITEIETETESTEVWESDIVKRVQITPQAVSKFINLAIRKGYIERFENVSDRRSIGVQITDRGRAALSKTEEELTAFRKSVLKEFSEEELARMHELMNKLQIATQKNYAKYKKK
jgi:DNA-binding MarR family transcriptional regulator